MKKSARCTGWANTQLLPASGPAFGSAWRKHWDLGGISIALKAYLDSLEGQLQAPAWFYWRTDSGSSGSGGVALKNRIEARVGNLLAAIQDISPAFYRWVPCEMCPSGTAPLSDSNELMRLKTGRDRG